MSSFTLTRNFKRYINGEQRSAAYSEDTYKAWRATIKWTDEQIAAALNEYADMMPAKAKYFGDVARLEAAYLLRTGSLSAAVLGKALNLLVRKCDICGRKALYRLGQKGRCSEHRHVPEHHTTAKQKRMDAKRVLYQNETERVNKIDLSRRNAMSASKFSRKPKA